MYHELLLNEFQNVFLLNYQKNTYLINISVNRLQILS